MIYSQTQFYQTKGSLIIIFLVTASFMFTGCGDENPASSEEEELEGAEVVIEPQDVSLEVDEQIDFSAFIISASGDTVNEEFDFEWNWYSSNPEVFTVQNNGTASGQSPGEAYCIVEVETENSKIAAKAIFVGRDSAFVSLF